MKKNSLVKYTAEQLREAYTEYFVSGAKYTAEGIIEEVNAEIDQAKPFQTDVTLKLINEALRDLKELKKAKKLLKKAGFTVKVQYEELHTLVTVSWWKSPKPPTLLEKLDRFTPYVFGLFILTFIASIIISVVREFYR